MKEVRFFISGVPSPGGSKSAFCLKKNGVYTGRAVVVDAGGKKTKEWRQDVAAAAMEAMRQADSAPLTGPVELELIFQMPRPKSHFRSDRVTLKPGSPLQHVTRPDCTKLARSTEDSLTSICFYDDGQIVKQSHEKAFSDQPGCWVIIKKVEDPQIW